MAIHWPALALTVWLIIATIQPEFGNTLATMSAESSEASAATHRLPKNLAPIRYKWTVKTFMPQGNVVYAKEKNFTFEGELNITFGCHEPTEVITLNQKDLDIVQTTVKVQQHGKNRNEHFSVTKMEMDKDQELVHFTLNGSLTKNNNYTIYMKYTGPINQKTLYQGLYVSTFTTADGEKRYITVSTMEPANARRALPCFDEPEMKAKFVVSIVHPVGTLALSNAKENHTSGNGDQWIRTDFQESPLMSSYLLAVAVVLDYKYLQKTVNNVRYRVYARSEAIEHGQFAIDVGPKMLAFYEEYFGSKYPLTKCDMLAVPDHRSASEEWGLMTFSEEVLLADPLYTTFDRQTVANVIAHELAHVWFGNLVTMRWWSDLWLKEGFANFAQMIGANQLTNPAYNLHALAVTNGLISMKDEHFDSSKALYVPINHTKDIVRSIITYNKGAALLRMIEAVLGKKVFLKGVQHYLDKHKYGNANHSELFEALQHNARTQSEHLGWYGKHIDVGKFARSWTLQSGFPLVTVRRQSGNQVTIKQERFKLNPDFQAPESPKWYIPIWYRVETNISDTKFSWLTPGGEVRELTKVDHDCWLLVNVGARSYYRVLYDEKSYNLLADALKTNDSPFSVEARCQLMDDVFVMAEAGRISYKTVFQMTEYLEYENSFLVWCIFAEHFKKIQKFVRDMPVYENVKNYLRNKLMYKYNSYGWKKQSRGQEQNLAAFMMETMCSLGHEDCNQKAISHFDDQISQQCRNAQLSSSCNEIDADFRATIYCGAVRVGSREIFNRMWKWLIDESMQRERTRILYALTCTTESTSVNWLMNETLFGNYLRKVDKDFVFYFAPRSSDIRPSFMWDFFCDNWQNIYDEFGEDKGDLQSVIELSLSNVNDNGTIFEIEEFLRQYNNTAKVTQFNSSLEVARANEKWMREHYNEVKHWFGATKEENSDEIQALLNK